MKLFVILPLLLLLIGCTKSEPDSWCWDCYYKDQVWPLCDWTQEKIDSLEARFNDPWCSMDSLHCFKTKEIYDL